MFDFDPAEFPEIEKERADAHESVRKWLALKQRWEAARGVDTPLPVEAYVDHPAYEGLKHYIASIWPSQLRSEDLEGMAQRTLSLVAMQPDGSFKVGGETKDQFEKSSGIVRHYIQVAIRTGEIHHAITTDTSLQVCVFVAALLWDEDVFFTPISIRMRLEVDHAG